MARLRARWAETQEKFKNIVLATEEDEAIFVQKGKEKLKITTKGQERARTPSRKALMSQGSDEPFSPSNDKDPKNFGAISEEQIIELARYVARLHFSLRYHLVLMLYISLFYRIVQVDTNNRCRWRWQNKHKRISEP